MASESREGQLELFDLSNQPVARLQRETLGRWLIQLRYDQMVLGGIATLLGITVVFACGVERGKQLVRSERMMIARQQVAAEPAAAPRARAPAASSQQAAPSAKPEAVAKPQSAEKPPPATSAPSAPAKAKEPSKVASAGAKAASSVSSRYAVQVVTYSQPTLAKREMDRLQARGERAFLLMRNGRTMVYVGPFPSKVNASEKLVSLRSHYRDCFIKPL